MGSRKVYAQPYSNMVSMFVLESALAPFGLAERFERTVRVECYATRQPQQRVQGDTVPTCQSQFLCTANGTQSPPLSLFPFENFHDELLPFNVLFIRLRPRLTNN